jgi:hypothetical protein
MVKPLKPIESSLKSLVLPTSSSILHASIHQSSPAGRQRAARRKSRRWRRRHAEGSGSNSDALAGHVGLGLIGFDGFMIVLYIVLL